MSKSLQLRFFLGIAQLLLPGCLVAEGIGSVGAEQVRELIEENHRLQAEVKAQSRTIEELRGRVNAIDQASTRNQEALQSLREQMAGGGEHAPAAEAASSEQAVRISAEAGFAFFYSGDDGLYSNGEFRMDDAKVFLEAPIWKSFFFHSELDLFTREASDSNLHLGEIYGEWELPDGSFNLRVGRMYTPFGEEYQVRGVIADPLISHSVSDIWGMDQGVEVFGQVGQASYFAAVQDGGINTLRNFHNDKSVAVRLGYDPRTWVHLSASAMRTGRLNMASDQLSALWFGNGFFRSIGPAATTAEFWANLGEADASVHWTGGYLKGAGGVVEYEDTNRAANDTRHMTYYYVEAKQVVSDPLYAAARFSQVRVARGYPLAGQGTMGEYFFSSILSTSLSRFSVGLGYQFAAPLLLKVEYSPEWGLTTLGAHRDEENLFSTELAVKF